MPAVEKSIVAICLTSVMVFAVSCDRNNKKTFNGGRDSSLVLLFNGTGVSPNDVIAFEQLLNMNHVNYETADSRELNAMPSQRLVRYRLLIFPGGDFIKMGQSINESTSARIRVAVQQGVNYFGVCGGAFLAGNSSVYHGFNLTSGVAFGFYSLENRGIRKSAVVISTPDASTLDQYWEDGPELSGWGDTVAKYPDHTPAIAEGRCGKGLVILSGIHAEASAKWRGAMPFRSSVEDDNRYALMLIDAALNNAPLPHY